MGRDLCALQALADAVLKHIPTQEGTSSTLLRITPLPRRARPRPAPPAALRSAPSTGPGGLGDPPKRVSGHGNEERWGV